MSNGDSDKYSDYATREAVIEDVNRTLEVDWDAGIVKLETLRKLESEELKRDLYALAWQVGLAKDDIVRRQDMTSYLVEALASDTSFLRGQVLRFLQDFSKNDFDMPTLKILKELTLDDEHANLLIRLIGVVDLQARRPELKQIAGVDWEESDPTALHNSPQWSAALALARMGDNSSMHRIIERVRSETDIVARATLLFGDLAYTRQQPAFDVLRSYLGSTERLPQVKESVKGELEARYAATLFAKFTANCPVQGPDVEETDIPRIRDWAAMQRKWSLK